MKYQKRASKLHPASRFDWIETHEPMSQNIKANPYEIWKEKG